MKTKVLNGNEACAHISYMFTEIAGVYPITPATQMSETIEKYRVQNKKNIFNNEVEITEMQSETGAIALVHGALQTGSLSSTYTSSQGLLLMIPSMYKIAGECLPCVINVATRTISTHALSIFGDHSDIYAARSTGFSFLSSSSVQDVMYMTLISYLTSIKSSMPFVNFFDGFRTSHEESKIDVLDNNDIKEFIPIKEIDLFKKNSLLAKKVVRGTTQNDDIYFQNLESRNKYYEEIPDIVNKYMEKINKKFNTDYKPFNYYGDKNATKIIIAMGSVCESLKELVDIKNEQGEKVGIIIVRLFRPFSIKYLLDVLPETVTKIAVLDRAKETVDREPLYLDIVNAVSKLDRKVKVIGGRYGISSKDTSISELNAVFHNLDNEMIDDFTIGIKDDVTNRSLDSIDIKSNTKNIEMTIYGFGSDGMVSASKDIIKLVGENTNGFVQGYNRYDSKKSGGLTTSYLRISKEQIRQTYYIKNPHIVVVTKEEYLEKYDVLSNIRKDGIFILATDNIDKIPDNIKSIIKSRNLKFYIIDAYKIAKDNNIENKISMIMEYAIIHITKLLSSDFAKEKIKEKIISNYKLKGEEIVNNNINALESVIDNIKEIEVDDKWNEIIIKYEKRNKMLDKLIHNEGYDISVKELLPHKDGSFDVNTSYLDTNSLSSVVPDWNVENCIECNKCSIVCPHGVITPKILSKDELKDNKDIITIDLIGKEDYKYALEINYDKCTGCGVCANTCLGKRGNKALTMIRRELSKRVNNKIIAKEKELFDDNTIKGIGFKEPLFKYSGACAGCGETPYLKLLTQLFKDQLVISNATGCSSIYGGSMPTSPYNISWSNSLFEDNAEYGLGFRKTIDLMNKKIEEIMTENMDKVSDHNKELFNEWINNKDNYNITKKVKEEIDYTEVEELKRYKEYIDSKSIWIIGGDGWSYDIGFSGIDHVMSSNENVNILILDNEIYSNTGGQASKSTQKGASTKLSLDGKKESKKDLARMLLTYKNVYIAHICLGANINQTIKALKEAKNHDGPSLIIAYAPCINHGIKAGMKNMIEEEILAVKSGYFPLFRYNGKKLILDFKEPKFDLYDKFIENENRYQMIKNVSSSLATRLLKENKEDSIERFNYYKDLSEK